MLPRHYPAPGADIAVIPALIALRRQFRPALRDHAQQCGVIIFRQGDRHHEAVPHLPRTQSPVARSLYGNPNGGARATSTRVLTYRAIAFFACGKAGSWA